MTLSSVVTCIGTRVLLAPVEGSGDHGIAGRASGHATDSQGIVVQ